MLQSFSPQGTTVTIQALDAVNRILTAPVYSNRTNPPLLLAGPDGIAVVSTKTSGATEDTPVELDVPRVNTGMPVPEGFDAVIPIEEVTSVAEGRYQIKNTATPLQNTIPKGSDIKEGDLVMDAGHILIPLDIGALLTYGIREVSVKNWKIGLMATGDEIVPPNKNPLAGQIIDSNSYVIAAFLRQFGISPVLAPVTPDNPGCIAEELAHLLDTCDMVIIFGGSSAGSKDFTVDALQQAGSLLFHGVAMAPGKPVSLANVNGKPVFGMPGPSIGSLMVLYELVYPLLKQWGVPIPSDTYTSGFLTSPVTSFDGFDMFLMMSVHEQDGKIMITPVERRFGQMMGVRSDAILHKAPGSGTIKAGEEVKVRMIRSPLHG